MLILIERFLALRKLQHHTTNLQVLATLDMCFWRLAIQFALSAADWPNTWKDLLA